MDCSDYTFLKSVALPNLKITSDCADVSEACELKLSWDGVGDTLLAVKMKYILGHTEHNL